MTDGLLLAGLRDQCMMSRFNGGYMPWSIDWSSNNRSFYWNVDEQYTLQIGNQTAGRNETFQAPGDWSLFIAVQKEDMDSQNWAHNDYQYWTSPRYVVGNNPLPSNGVERKIS